MKKYKREQATANPLNLMVLMSEIWRRTGQLPSIIKSCMPEISLGNVDQGNKGFRIILNDGSRDSLQTANSHWQWIEVSSTLSEGEVQVIAALVPELIEKICCLRAKIRFSGGNFPHELKALLRAYESLSLERVLKDEAESSL